MAKNARIIDNEVIKSNKRAYRQARNMLDYTKHKDYRLFQLRDGKWTLVNRRTKVI